MRYLLAFSEEGGYPIGPEQMQEGMNRLFRIFGLHLTETALQKLAVLEPNESTLHRARST